MSAVAPHTVDRTEKAIETRIAAYLLTEYLERLGVEVMFGLCGHTIIALLDALGKSRIRFVSTRHEQVAAHAADGYARASGKTGVLLTHLGPGLTNACTGVANAALDSIPMVVIAGDVPSHYYGRHPHQEVNLHQDADQFQIYRPFCKRVYRVDRVEDLPRVIERAFHLAQAGRPGPVLVDVPMDLFSADLPLDAFQQMPTPLARPTIEPSVAAHIIEALAVAERPVLYVGGGVLSARATRALATLAAGKAHRDRGRLREEITRGRRAFAENWDHQWNSDQYPLRPERILAELRKAVPADGFIVTDVGWNKNGVGQQFPITVPGTFITPSGLATMGFGPSAVLGVTIPHPDRAAVSLIGDGGFSTNPSVIATAMEAELPVVWLVMDNAGFGTIAGLESMHYGWSFGCMFERCGKPYKVDYAAMARAFGARGVMIESAGR